ncbi:zinc metalloprotease HtpX [Heliorestis convoluta]|uniref:Protease HtpX homolog n=1 Tax=Heliorestis convoluta TaxID=356322 RepID=A0A5Q2N205_9FIRM|nr:zinc metalloprotease HtpX [Heliorestis convoluta]QGG46380.1 zinc metalloprotease HtpX [Heliorestis convoluta]
MILYQQIESNKRKSIFIVLAFVSFILLLGGLLSYAQTGDWLSGAITAAVIAVIYVAFVLFQSTRMLMRLNGAQRIESRDHHPFLWHTVEGLALAARIPMPQVYIISDPSPNAFAAGLKPESATVAVTSGLLDRLNREEVEAVVAHEIAHIRNYDVRLATIAIALVAVVAIISDFGMRMFFFGKRRNNNNLHPAILVIALIFVILSPLVATFIQLALSRNREFLADSDGAALNRNPEALARALEKISTHPEPVESAKASSAALYIADPLKKKVSRLFATHPPVEERVARLRKM